VVCRRGNDSQLAVDILNKHLNKKEDLKCIKDVIGGLQAWANTVDPTFPSY
jgi:adenylyltransferase/sulfurtransferase